MVALTAGMLVDSQSPVQARTLTPIELETILTQVRTVHQLFATLAGRALFRNV